MAQKIPIIGTFNNVIDQIIKQNGKTITIIIYFPYNDKILKMHLLDSIDYIEYKKLIQLNNNDEGNNDTPSNIKERLSILTNKYTQKLNINIALLTKYKTHSKEEADDHNANDKDVKYETHVNFIEEKFYKLTNMHIKIFDINSVEHIDSIEQYYQTYNDLSLPILFVSGLQIGGTYFLLFRSILHHEIKFKELSNNTLSDGNHIKFIFESPNIINSLSK